jgi:TonB-dependent receptor
LKKSNRSHANRSHASNKAQRPLPAMPMKPLAVLIAMYCSGAMADPTMATDTTAPTDNLQEIVVTGLRQSLVTNETIKRDTNGIVDAITAEDIGKFPDTNLAESIQRIPGVTIDRLDNEGTRVTVRGFGPEFNLVTLNGRSMPGNLAVEGVAGSGAVGNATATRSFDFENLSADGISGIEVYKTGRADVASGGIGSTINITTARPFDFNTMKATFSAKATDDTSSKVGSKVTPEFSGLFSDTFFDDRVGFLVNGSYSKRNSQEQRATIDGWLENQFGPGAGNSSTLALTNNNTNPDGNNWAPRNEGWGVEDHQRERVNGQAVLQFKPVDSLVATFDYTYSFYKDLNQSHTYGAWFDYGGSPYSAIINPQGTVTQLVDTGSDDSYNSSNDETMNQNGSAGMNLKWHASENIVVNFDAHHSTADSGGGALGTNNFGIVGQIPGSTTSLYKCFTMGPAFPTSGPGAGCAGIAAAALQIPTTSFLYAAPYTMANLGTNTIEPLFGSANDTIFNTTIEEALLDATWQNSDTNSGLKSIKVGIDVKRTTTEAEAFSSGNFAWGYYNTVDEGFIPASAFTKAPSCAILKQFTGGGCGIQIPFQYTFGLPYIIPITQAGGRLIPPPAGSPPGTPNTLDPNFPPYTFAQAKTPNSDDHIREDTPAPFLQMDFATTFDGMPFKALAGIRYEKTNVTANSLQEVPTSISWNNPTEFSTNYAATATFSDVKASYAEFLPNLDMSLEVLSGLLLRGSYSKTIARSDLTQMIGTTSVTSTPKPGSRTATEGNPGLLPYESNNIDFGAEWYYSKGSYVAANWFTKHVTNFLTEVTTQEPLFGLTDPNAGALATKATAEVVAAGKAPSAQNIYAQIQADTASPGPFLGQPGDPLVIWDVTTPTNGNKTDIHGFELSVQHLFGDTGFGVQANWSVPTGGAPWNSETINSQFALPGLSRSYNFVGFFERWGFQTRVAYSHRGAFLAALNQTDQDNEPIYTAAYGQLDMSASYDINRHFSVIFDGINLTSASMHQYGRFTDQFVSATEGFARYQLGFRVVL